MTALEFVRKRRTLAVQQRHSENMDATARSRRDTTAAAAAFPGPNPASAGNFSAIETPSPMTEKISRKMRHSPGNLRNQTLYTAFLLSGVPYLFLPAPASFVNIIQ